MRACDEKQVFIAQWLFFVFFLSDVVAKLYLLCFTFINSDASQMFFRHSTVLPQAHLKSSNQVKVDKSVFLAIAMAKSQLIIVQRGFIIHILNNFNKIIYCLLNNMNHCVMILELYSIFNWKEYLKICNFWQSDSLDDFFVGRLASICSSFS